MTKDTYEFGISRMDADSDLAATRDDIERDEELAEAEKCELYSAIIRRLIYLRRASRERATTKAPSHQG